jgi:hypothetical protein
MTHRLVVTSSLLMALAACNPVGETPSSTDAAGSEGAMVGGGKSEGGASGVDSTSPLSGASGASPAGGANGGSAAQGGTPSMNGGGSAGATAPAGIPDDYELLLDESFAEPGSLDMMLAGNPDDWTHSDEEGGFLQYAGVGYAPPNPPIPESFTSFALVSGIRFGTFVLEVELMQRNPDQAIPQRDMCIVFNIQSETEYYYAHIAQGHTDRWHNIHIIDNAPRRPITLADNGGINWGLDEWHKFRIARDTTTGAIDVYMDDDLTVPILTANDSTFQDGYVGFATHQDGGRIRNLKVWGPSAVEQPAPSTFFE